MKEENKSLGDYYQYPNRGYNIDAVAEIAKIMHQQNSIFDDVVEDWQNEPTVSLETNPEVSPYMILI